MIFFLADTHFGDDAIRRYENRPFGTAEEMDEAIIRGWNETVSAEDTVYLLGDLGAEGREREVVGALNGRVLLVKGNHDPHSNREYRDMGFAEVYDHPILLDGFWLLSHEPLYVSDNMPYANIFGHVHNNPQYRDYSSHHFCVSAERVGYRPIDFDRVKRAVAEGLPLTAQDG